MVVEPICPGSSSPTTESPDRPESAGNDGQAPDAAAFEAEQAESAEPIGSSGAGDLATGASAAARGDWGPAGRTAMRAKVIAEMPSWYSPLGHFVFPALFGLGVIGVCVHYVTGLRHLELLTIPFTLLLSNAIEWFTHRDVLHKRSGMMPILYERHTPVHHKLFTTDDMAITDWRELRNVMLPAFGVIAILSLQLPLLGIALLVGLRNVALLFMATSMAYVLLYEWLHLAYHLPVDSFIGRRTVIRWLARHHALHHDPKLMQRWNMNVTLPLWDWLSGTMYDATRYDATRSHATGYDPERSRSAAARRSHAQPLHRGT